MEVTIYDIAKRLDISPTTVSRGLKDHPRIGLDTRKRIQDAARKMGYRQNLFATNLRRQRTNTLGVIIPRINSYFMSTVISGMEKVANAAGFNLIIAQSQESFEKELANVNTLFNSRVDGLMVSLAMNTCSQKHFNIFRKKSIPIVFFDRCPVEGKDLRVVINNKRAGFDATTHLIEQGCKNIIHLAGSLNRNVYADRLAGYKKALIRHQLDVKDENILENILTAEDAETAVTRILRLRRRPDGIFACNDIVAATCIRKLKEEGFSIPGQIAVVGFNDDPVAKLIEPALTTIQYPGDRIGEMAASTLIDQVNKRQTKKENTIVLPHELVVRKSSVRKIKRNP